MNRLRQALIDVAFKAAPHPSPPTPHPTTLLGKKPKCLPVSQPNILLIPKTGMIFQASQQKQQIIMTTIKTISIVPSLLFHKDLSTEVKIAKYREAAHTFHSTLAPILATHTFHSTLAPILATHTFHSTLAPVHKDLSTEVKIAKYREATHTLHSTVAPIPQRP